MKKYHLLAVVAFLLAVLMCVPAMAEEAAQPVATAHRAADVTIDGDLSDWNTNDPIVLNDASQLVRDGHFWNGPDDLSANVYIAWDETYLYIGADVTEDSVFGAIETLPLERRGQLRGLHLHQPGRRPRPHGVRRQRFQALPDYGWRVLGHRL